MTDDLSTVDELFEGAIDTQAHGSPSAFSRHNTDLSLARAARERGMRAVVVKNHHFETASRAALVREETGFDLRGGITLNEWVGGLNPAAVDAVANFDADVVWLPSITAANHLENADVQLFAEEADERSGISVLDDDGRLREEALAVIDRIAAHDLVVGLSHLSPSEAIRFTEAAVDRGVDELLVQHPHANFLGYSLEEMRTITDLGATLELQYICNTGLMDEAASAEDYVLAIDAVGPENVVLATDGGATANPPAVEGFEAFLRLLLDAGVPTDDVETMVKTNPCRILGLE